MKRIYHGSKDIIQKPTYGHGKVQNDYGLGFYCTYDKDLAKEWSVDSSQHGYANEYELDCEGLRILDLYQEEYGILYWLALLLSHREYEFSTKEAIRAKEAIQEQYILDYDKYDIIHGYRAYNCSVSFVQDFMNGAISYCQLYNAMQLGNLGHQFVLKSQQAFDRIQFIGHDRADSSDWFTKKEQRVKAVHRDYYEIERKRYADNDIFIEQITNKKVNLKELQEILKNC